MSAQKPPNAHNYIIIMAGGAGTRLWPVSRRDRPKQFQAFWDEETLLQHMASIARQVVPLNNLFIMATPEFRQTILTQIPDLPANNILYEPARRDNGPAALLAFLQIAQRDPEAVIAILWSDHLIQKPEVLARTLATSFLVQQEHPDHLITIGAKPTSPDTGYGYIKVGEVAGHTNDQWVFQVTEYIEKPNLETAKTFLNQWQYFWNVGYKTMSAAFFLEKLAQVQPDLKPTIAALKKLNDSSKPDQTEISRLYDQLPKLSIEYLFTQKIKEILVIPADLGWSDIGSWNSLHDIIKQSGKEDLTSKGRVICLDSPDCLIMADKLLIATLGIRDLVIVEDNGALLVMDKKRAQDIKLLTALLEEKAPDLL